ncbi:MAG: hypothetical protein AAGA30_15050 [Planctomycetota bacterium]
MRNLNTSFIKNANSIFAIEASSVLRNVIDTPAAADLRDLRSLVGSMHKFWMSLFSPGPVQSEAKAHQRSVEIQGRYLSAYPTNSLAGTGLAGCRMRLTVS